MTDNLHLFLRRFRRRLRILDGWRMVQRTLRVPALAALMVQMFGRFWPVERLDAWSLATLLFWLLFCLGWSAFHSLPLARVAQRIDLTLGLRERLSTALALEKPSQISDPIYLQLVQAQRQDAMRAASVIVPSRALPLAWQPRYLAVAVILAIGALVSAWLPNPMDITLAQRQAVRQEAARQAERVEQLRQQVEQADELSPEEREQLMRQLAELTEKLRANRGDLEQSIADLSNLEKQLSERLDPAALAQQANLEALAARLEALTGKTRQPEQSAADAAAQALAELAVQLPSLTPEQQSELARELAQMASQAAQSGDAQLAQALSALAQAAQTGDAQVAQQAAQGAQQALSQAQARLADQNALQQAIGELQSGRQALAQAAQQAAQQAALAQGQSPSQNAGQNPGQNPSQSPGQPGAGQGQASSNVSGGGSQASTLPPATGGRGNVRPRGEAPNIAPGDMSNQVYAPWQRPAGNGGELTIPGQETGQGETQTTQGQSNLPGAANPSLVPYQQVFYNYLSAANQALGQSYIPAGMTDYIREYFSQLNP